MTRVALCFPGQGSQAAGMAAGLEGPDLELLFDAAAREGLDLRSALLHGDEERLRATEIAQPALLAVEVSLARRLPAGIDVVGVAGHSVGEYAAAVASGALSSETAMSLVVARGRAMAAMRSGAMSALLGLDAAAVEAICAEVTAARRGEVVVANINAPGQTVVSGDVEAVAAVEGLAKERGARRALRLNVSGAFHSPLMRDAAAAFAPHLEAAGLRDPSIPIVCNVDGEAVTDAASLRARLARQLVSPVRWTDCVQRLVALGAEVLLEVGPAAVLTGLARRIVPGVRAASAATPEQLSAVDTLVGTAP